MEKSFGEVAISDNQSKLVLRPTGPPQMGFPMEIVVKSGPFTTHVNHESRDYSPFRHALGHLYRTLSGEARLTFWGEQSEITFKAHSRGQIAVGARIVSNAACLTIDITFDQTYLPPILDSLDRCFSTD